MGTVVAVSLNKRHVTSKAPQPGITLLAGLGVEGDAHMGERVKHRIVARYRPHLPNLRQVHLIHAELLDELNAAGFDLAPGVMGENVLTRGVDLLSLPKGTRLRLGAQAVVELTGLRNPCVQLDRLRPGLAAATVARNEAGKVVVRRAGVMAIVLEGGEVKPGDEVVVELPPEPHEALKPV